jgi:hypothetical protein
MKALSRIFLLTVGLASSLGAAAARAGGLVEFPNLADHAPSKLLGYLARPDAGLSERLGGHATVNGRYPAVVVLHGCGGFSSHSAQVADRIGSWGYVALAVDSLGARGFADRCGVGWLLDQPFDAYAALRYLSQLDFVEGGGSRFSATRWAGFPRSMRSIATRLRNISKSGFMPPSPITRAATSARQ